MGRSVKGASKGHGGGTGDLPYSRAPCSARGIEVKVASLEAGSFGEAGVIRRGRGRHVVDGLELHAVLPHPVDLAQGWIADINPLVRPDHDVFRQEIVCVSRNWHSEDRGRGSYGAIHNNDLLPGEGR